jgi:putative sterol carrier protein
VEGKVEGAQVTYEMSSDTFLAIHRKELSGMKAYAQKLVKVKASMPDLLKLQKLDSL